ncbi:hypothetical protein KC865_01765 [Candidatus Kaiserbacteria bacterium]|nr:hypothetical protein [Candidatus Kaiserbacteria bacterium]USN91986.1 MAG: hypothetical protein H6782_03870 [Candidatus Nomurabacteria bacterium]
MSDKNNLVLPIADLVTGYQDMVETVFSFQRMYFTHISGIIPTVVGDRITYQQREFCISLLTESMEMWRIFWFGWDREFKFSELIEPGESHQIIVRDSIVSVVGLTEEGLPARVKVTETVNS